MIQTAIRRILLFLLKIKEWLMISPDQKWKTGLGNYDRLLACQSPLSTDENLLEPWINDACQYRWTDVCSYFLVLFYSLITHCSMHAMTTLLILSLTAPNEIHTNNEYQGIEYWLWVYWHSTIFSNLNFEILLHKFQLNSKKNCK